MDIHVQPGRYILAVSGGVDSMVLLDLLRRRPGLELIIAHFDHGIRPDSAEDRRLVQDIAARHQLPFVYAEGRLGPQASEASARQARYEFLEGRREQHNARAIITAHHQDDVLETAILNLLRGTGRLGLSSLADSTTLIRPLLHVKKQDMLDYAAANQLTWREDSTNADDRYLRNYIRHHILPRFDEPARSLLLEIIGRSRMINRALDDEILELLASQENQMELNRHAFQQLPHAVAKEVLAAWLRQHRVGNFDARTLERVVVSAKVQPPGALLDIIGGATLLVTKDSLALYVRER